MTKKKQNNIFNIEFDPIEFDLCKDEYNLEAEIEPGYRLYVPWLHREFWEEQDLNQEANQENEARTKQGEFTLEQRTNNGEFTLEAQKGQLEQRERSRKKSDNLARRN